jgi:hypothetical protein
LFLRDVKKLDTSHVALCLDLWIISPRFKIGGRISKTYFLIGTALIFGKEKHNSFLCLKGFEENSRFYVAQQFRRSAQIFTLLNYHFCNKGPFKCNVTLFGLILDLLPLPCDIWLHCSVTHPPCDVTLLIL